MNREERYVVIKHTDIEDILSDSDKLILSAVLARIDRVRKEKGKEPLKAVVVEADWPEYEPTWKAIESRVKKASDDEKFAAMFDKLDMFGYFYVVRTRKGDFLLTSDAHSPSRLRGYSGYKFRAMFSPDCGFDAREVLHTNWGIDFKFIVQVSKEQLLELYDPNKSISNYNVAEFITDKLRIENSSAEVAKSLHK